MKKSLLFLLFVIYSMTLFPQELKFEDLKSDKRPQGPFITYVSKNGTIYKVGDKIKIGVPSSNKTFAFITKGDGIMMEPEQLDAKASNSETQIKNIIIGGLKRTGFYAILRTKGTWGALPVSYTVQIENALEAGEIKHSGYTSDEALSELKKNKDKLELGLITQEQYDSTKAVLIKFIK